MTRRLRYGSREEARKANATDGRGEARAMLCVVWLLAVVVLCFLIRSYILLFVAIFATSMFFQWLIAQCVEPCSRWFANDGTAAADRWDRRFGDFVG